MKELVIIGNGLASQYLVEALCESDGHGFAITIVDAEGTPAYDRVKLTPWLAGHIRRDDLFNRNTGLGSSDRIKCMIGAQATSIDVTGHTATLDGGATLPWDELVFATGAIARRPDVPGDHLPGVMTLRTLADFEALQDVIRPGLETVVLGGGTLGIESALALRARGCQVTLVHTGPWPLHRVIDSESGRILTNHLTQRGVDVRLNATASAFSGSGQVNGVHLSDGSVLPCARSIIALGVTPATDLARTAGLDCHRGVVCDGWMRTSAPNVYALGDCAEIHGETRGTVAPIQGQIKVLGAVLRGVPTPPWTPAPEALRLDTDDLGILAVGNVPASIGRSLSLNDPVRQERRRIDLVQGRLRYLLSLDRDHGDMAALVRKFGNPLSYDEALDALLDGSAREVDAA